MADQLLASSISSVSAVASAADGPRPVTAGASEPAHAERTAQAHVGKGAPAVTGPLTQAGAARPEPKPQAAPEAPRNIQLHFKVDPKTNDVTVFMVDVSSRRVIRTIPPEELQKLEQGELVELLA